MRYRTASGASSYIYNLVPRLIEKNNEYEFVGIRFPEQTIPRMDGLETIICPDVGVAGQALWDQVVLPIRLKQERVHAYHSLKMLGSYFSPCPQLIVGHSILGNFKGEFPIAPQARLYWITLGNELFRRSARIIAVSHYVKEFLTEALGIPDERISVIYNGIDPRFTVQHKAEAMVSGGAIKKPYILTVGNIFPVKNHLTAARAFARIANQFPDLQLVMAGGREHPYFQTLARFVSECRLNDRVSFLGFVNADDLVGLYQHASLLLMPSLTEGFGLTVLEAMACGVPVIASRRGAIPEVGGDAIVLVDDPYDVKTWAEKMALLLDDKNALARMREKARIRSARFDWDRCAELTLNEYELLIRHQKRGGA